MHVITFPTHCGIYDIRKTFQTDVGRDFHYTIYFRVGINQRNFYIELFRGLFFNVERFVVFIIVKLVIVFFIKFVIIKFIILIEGKELIQ